MTAKDKLIKKLQAINNLSVKLHIPLRNYTSFKVGGPADIFLIPDNIQALQETIRITANFEINIFILGKGSNIIAGDRGFKGVIIYMGQLNQIQVKNKQIIAETGVTLNTLAREAMEAGLTGLEFASGIPGTLGGAIYMNAGAYGGEMKNIIQNTALLDYNGRKMTLNKQELKLSYRHSLLQEKPLIAVRASLKLESGNRDDILANMKKLNRKRKNKQPLTWPSAGSAFKRPQGHYTGPLIEKAGMKGVRVGDAQVSEKHAGFIINRGHATARDIQELIKKVQSEVYKTSGVQLEPEPKFIGEFD